MQLAIFANILQGVCLKVTRLPVVSAFRLWLVKNTCRHSPGGRVVMISDFYNDCYLIIMFPYSTEQRKEIGISLYVMWV